MFRTPIELDLLDDDALEAPRRMTPDDLHAEGGPGWRRRGPAPFEMENDQ